MCEFIPLYISSTVFAVGATLTIISGWYFWRLRNHFIITSRYPKITIFAVGLLYGISAKYVIADYLLCYQIISKDNIWLMILTAISSGILTALYFNILFLIN